MIGQLLVLALIAFIVSIIEVDAKFKQVAYFILGIALIVILLQLIGVNVPLS